MMERYRAAPKVTDGAAVKRPKALKEAVIPFLQERSRRSVYRVCACWRERSEVVSV